MQELTLGALLLILVKEVFSFFSTSSIDHAKALQENTLALTKLQVELYHIQKLMEQLPQMRSDIDHAHHRLEMLGAQINKEK